MARSWTAQEDRAKFAELRNLYVRKNKTINEVAALLRIAPQTVFDRLIRLGIPARPRGKPSYAARLRSDIILPRQPTPQLAEFFGIMLGDGHVAYYQAMVTLGNKETSYVQYVVSLMHRLFGVMPRVSIRPTGYRTVYLGSRALVQWLLSEGLVANKVRGQVGIPGWVYWNREYMVRFLRGFFDTDGSVYRLRFGIQIGLTNRSLPLLDGVRSILMALGYHPSVRSRYAVYLTRREEVSRFFREVRPANEKHVKRFEVFNGALCAGRPVGGGGRL